MLGYPTGACRRLLAGHRRAQGRDIAHQGRLCNTVRAMRVSDRNPMLSWVTGAVVELMALAGWWQSPVVHADEPDGQASASDRAAAAGESKQRAWQREFARKYPGYRDIGAIAGIRDDGVATETGVRVPVRVGNFLSPRRFYENKKAAFVAWQGYVHYAELLEAEHYAAALAMHHEHGRMPRDHELDLYAYTGWSKRAAAARDGFGLVVAVGEVGVALSASFRGSVVSARVAPAVTVPARGARATSTGKASARNASTPTVSAGKAPTTRTPVVPGRSGPGGSSANSRTASVPAYSRIVRRPRKVEAPARVRRQSSGRSVASSRELSKALEAAGHSRPVGTAAHHIVAVHAKSAAEARKILRRFGIGINDAANGVFLPRSRLAVNPGGSTVHSSVHTKNYYAFVNRSLKSVRSRAEVEGKLKQIRQMLLNGEL